MTKSNLASFSAHLACLSLSSFVGYEILQVVMIGEDGHRVRAAFEVSVAIA